MSMAQVFDPYTGGAIGGLIPSGYGPLNYIPVTDLTGPGWTFSDVNSRLTSYSYNTGTGEHSFDLVTLPNIAPTLYVDDSITTTLGNFNAPRASRALLDGNGVAMTSNDKFILVCKVEGLSSSVARNWAVGIGFSRDETSTDRNVVSFNGGLIGTNLTGTPSYGHVHVAGFTAGSLAGGVDLYVSSYFRGELTQKKNLGGISVLNNATDYAIASRIGGTVSYTAGVPIYLNVLVPTMGNVSETVGGLVTCKFSYAVVRL